MRWWPQQDIMPALRTISMIMEALFNNFVWLFRIRDKFVNNFIPWFITSRLFAR